MLAELRPRTAKYSGGATEVLLTLRSHADKTCVESDIEIVLVHTTTPPSVQIRLGEPLTAHGETPREAAAKFGRWLTRLGGALTLLADDFPASASEVPWVISKRTEEPAVEPPPNVQVSDGGAHETGGPSATDARPSWWQEVYATVVAAEKVRIAESIRKTGP